MIVTRSPFRITLGGGGTDLPSFYEKHGGFVVSMAINKYISITLKKNILEDHIRLQYLKTEIVNSPEELVHERAREALILHGIKKGIEISSIADLPAQGGLGSSGSYLVALLTAIRNHKRLSSDPETVAEEACDIEINKLQEPVGKQDQYISAFGGLKSLEISKNGDVKVESLGLSENDIRDLLSPIHVYYTGVLRSASEILKEQSKCSQKVEDSLIRIKEIGHSIKKAIQTRDFDKFGLLMDEHWKFKKSLSSKVTLSDMELLYEHVKKEYGVLGGKIIGAGGGGFIMLYAPQKGRELQEFMTSKSMPRLNYDLDYLGNRTIANFG